MNTPELGKLPGGPTGRDAVHVAIVAVQATCELCPGWHVDHLGKLDGKSVGIVDPFLQQLVKPGDWFWLCLYPQSVTSLRHVWTHPVFTAAAQKERL
jgi:hypothetical protein